MTHYFTVTINSYMCPLPPLRSILVTSPVSMLSLLGKGGSEAVFIGYDVEPLLRTFGHRGFEK